MKKHSPRAQTTFGLFLVVVAVLHSPCRVLCGLQPIYTLFSVVVAVEPLPISLLCLIPTLVVVVRS